jgi:hypothetical protein
MPFMGFNRRDMFFRDDFRRRRFLPFPFRFEFERERRRRRFY